MTGTPVLSIIVPVYREPVELCRLLAWLARCDRISDTEIIIVDGDDGSSMIPEDILPVRTLTSLPGRGRQLNRGAAAATASTLAFLHVDTRPPGNFVSLILRSTTTRAAGAFDLHIRTRSPIVRLISVAGLVRSRLTRLPYGDQLQFITRDLFTTIGAFPAEPLMEDVALMDRLKERNVRIRFLRPAAVTSGRRWESEGAIRTTLRNWRLMIAYRAGIPPRVLRGRYRPQADLERPNTLAVFFRSLRPGRVKTRLAAETGDRTALALYTAMLTDLAAATRRLECRGHDSRALWFVDTFREGTVLHSDAVPQIGDDLWKRMQDAIARCFAAGARRVVLVGSDIPGLTATTFTRAFRLLGSHDLVLGCSADGGFYLIGARDSSHAQAALQYAAVAPAESGARIEAYARTNGLAIARLRTRTDVDTLSDLQAILTDHRVHAPALRLAARRLLP